MTDGQDILGDAMAALESARARGFKWVELDGALAKALSAPVRPALASPSPVTPRETKPATSPGTMPPPAAAPAPARPAPLAPRPALHAAPGTAALTPRRVTPEQIAAMDWPSLEREVTACHACRLCQARTQTVFADGTHAAKLMFIGEGPGEEEDLQGKPFVGRAGQLLTKMIEAMGLQRQEVCIVNIVKCRPPGNRNPDDEEARECLPFVKRQIDLVHPCVIVLLGAVPLKHLTGLTGIMSKRGKWLQYQDIPVMPTYHPAFLLRAPVNKRDAWLDLQAVIKKLGLPPKP